MKEIALSRGMVALVDDADYDAVMAAGPWFAEKGHTTFYAGHMVYNGSQRQIMRMHQFVLELHGLEGKGGDHKNHNGLDNQFHNLRAATQTQNSQHRRKFSTKNGYVTSSKHKGVGYHKATGKWPARITVNGKRHPLGYFNNDADAALAYNIAAWLAYGEFAVLNQIHW